MHFADLLSLTGASLEPIMPHRRVLRWRYEQWLCRNLLLFE
jgi:hypothetical protein